MSDQSVIDQDYAAFVRKARRFAGADLDGYKPDQMRRRLVALAARHGAITLTQFAEVMERDERAATAFKNFFTINVSEFLRDASRWNDLAQRVIPALHQEGGRQPLKIWSAGCSYGAETYSLAMVLDETAPGRAHVITGTDIDETILERARRGAGYTLADLRGVDAARRGRYFTKEADGTYSIKDALKMHVRFRRQDLLTEVPAQGLDLIVCRNVVIYFKEDAKRAMYERMVRSLRPGGILFVGGTEVVAGARELGLDAYMTSFYRKPAAALKKVA